MTDPGITLNIYNKPPDLEENTNKDINQEDEEGVQQTLDLPTKSVVDNVGSVIPNASSAPKANYGVPPVDNTTNNNTVETSDNYESSVQPIPTQQYPQPIMGYPQPQMRPIPVTPIQTPMVQPYNAQYAQPVIVQPRVNNPPPKAIIIKKREKENPSRGDCCTGFLAGCGAFLAACCLLSLCTSGGGRYGRRGRW